MPWAEIVVCFGLSYQFFQQGNILVGTKSGDIYGITEKSSSSQVVVNSHTEGEIWGLCAHPEKDVFVTGSSGCPNLPSQRLMFKCSTNSRSNWNLHVNKTHFYNKKLCNKPCFKAKHRTNQKWPVHNINLFVSSGPKGMQQLQGLFIKCLLLIISVSRTENWFRELKARKS